MREIYYITKRNCQVFFRDKAAVFFSILSMLIVLGLTVIFLGSMNSRSVVNVLAEYGGVRDTAKDEKNAEYLIQLWTLAGILVVNSVTVTLTVMGNMVQDETRKRIMAFYVTPVNRIKLTLGYIFSAWLVGIIMCVLTLAAGELYFLIKGNDLLSVVHLLKLFVPIRLLFLPWDISWLCSFIVTVHGAEYLRLSVHWLVLWEEFTCHWAPCRIQYRRY